MTDYVPMPGEMTTSRLTLEPWRDEDLDDFYALIHERDPRTAAAPRDGRPSRADVRASIARIRNSITDTGIGMLTVRRNGQYLGYCRLTVGRASFDEPELAYELLRREHGHGYATEAALAVLAAAGRTGRSRLWASVRSWNDASFRVVEKLGFERTSRAFADDFGESQWCTRQLV